MTMAAVRRHQNGVCMSPCVAKPCSVSPASYLLLFLSPVLGSSPMSRSQPAPPVGPVAHVSGLMLMTTYPINTWKSCDTQGFLALHQHDSSLHLPFPRLSRACPSPPCLPLVLAVLCRYSGKLSSCLIGKRHLYRVHLYIVSLYRDKHSAWKRYSCPVVNLSELNAS